MKLNNIKVAHITLAILTSMLVAFSAKATGTGFTNEFWISTNATGNFYSSGALGTLDNPLDGSTASNFDANMASLPAYSAIHILAGTYQTWGTAAYRPKSGQKILGSGIDVTILQLSASAMDAGTFSFGSGVAVIGTDGFITTNIELCNLTLDCNYQPGANCTLCGADLEGYNHIIRHVKLINAAKFGGNSESWGLEIESYGSTLSTGNIIEDCQVSQFAGGPAGTENFDALVLEGNTCGIIRDNYVSGTLTKYTFAVSPGVGPTLIEGNQIYEAANVSYSEGGFTNVIFAHNSFIDCPFIVHWPTGGEKNVTFAYNDIIATNDIATDPSSVMFSIGGTSTTNIIFEGNIVTCSAAEGVTYLLLMDAANVTGLTIINNSFDSKFANSFTGCLNVNIDNNYDLFGNYLTSFNNPTIGGTPVTSFGLSLIGSAGASPALEALGLPSNPLDVVTNGSTQSIIFNTNLVVNGPIFTPAVNENIPISGAIVGYGDSLVSAIYPLHGQEWSASSGSTFEYPIDPFINATKQTGGWTNLTFRLSFVTTNTIRNYNIPVAFFFFTNGPSTTGVYGVSGNFSGNPIASNIYPSICQIHVPYSILTNTLLASFYSYNGDVSPGTNNIWVVGTLMVTNSP